MAQQHREMTEARESELVERARLGDREAFDELMEAHLPRVWRVAYRIVRHDQDAEDVVQETFLAAFRTIPAFRQEAKLSTWLTRIATSRALNHLDRSAERVRRAGRPIELRPSELELGVPEPVATGPSPLQALERKELAARLVECLDRLPGPWRSVLALREGEGLSYEEIAATMDLNLGTVRSRLARARVALRDCIEGRSG